MHWLISSGAAWHRFANALPSGSARRIQNPRSFAEELSSESDSLGLICDIEQVDDVLARSVTKYQTNMGRAVGILPYSESVSKAFERHFQPTEGVSLADARFVLYSSDSGFNKDITDFCDSLGTGTQARIFDCNAEGVEIASALRCEPVTVFAAQASGRQTFIQLGRGRVSCLYPDLHGTLRGDAGAITPTNCAIEHMLVQSCHSPFVWSDFGSGYLSVPLAFLSLAKTRSFITSTRVQSVVPALIPYFLQLALHGETLGEIVVALNRYARNLLIEDDPFILFGHPDSRIVSHGVARSLQCGTVTEAGTRHFLALARTLAHIIENLTFTTGMFAPSDVVGEEAERLRKAVARLRTDFDAKVHRMRLPLRFPEAAQARNLTEFASGLLRQGHEDPLVSLLVLVRKFWHSRRGFYYHFSDLIENEYLPDDCQYTGRCCPVCQSLLLEKRVIYGGVGAPADYQTRVQETCSRCLVSSDTRPCVRDSTLLHVTRGTGSMVADLEYTNQSDRPQWIFAFATLVDPNNVTERIRKDVRAAVAGPIKVTQPNLVARQVEPNETVPMKFEVSNIVPDLFYALLELNLFVDGCWNWFGVTWRATSLRDWLASELYLETLPHIS